MTNFSPHILLRASGALALTAALAGCGSSQTSASSGPSGQTGATASPPSSAGAVKISIRGYAYQPVALSVAAGTRVTFTNHDATAHTATASTPAFDTGTLKPGQSATVTLKTAGTYSYICQFHAFMHGTITVK
jgi:plastocyanin